MIDLLSTGARSPELQRRCHPRGWQRALLPPNASLPILVGVVLSVTHTLVRMGALEASMKAVQHSRMSALVGQPWASFLSTPSFVVPQVDKWCGVILMVASLAGSKLHIGATVANGVSIAATAKSGQFLLWDNLDQKLRHVDIFA